MTAEGGGLGLACLNRNRIALWARETAPNGVALWVQRRTIDLKRLHPPLLVSDPKRRPCLSGVIPGEDKVIFVSTEDGVFRIDLETLQVRKVCDIGNDVKIIYPFVSFFTETLLVYMVNLTSLDVLLDQWGNDLQPSMRQRNS
ncbi:hypothetical protein EJB05_37966, partial [Eragrostis curvula]